MKRLCTLLSFLATLATLSLGTQAAEPLRLFIRAGKKSHGPNAHEHERFLEDWKKELSARGIKTDGALEWPTAAQFAATDVLVMYAQDGGNATDEQKANLAAFTKRGGGIVVIHTAAVSNDSVWWKSVIGGAWVAGTTKFKEGPTYIYYTENQRLDGGHPITRGASNFLIDDEIYYDMDISPDVRVLASAYTPNGKNGAQPAKGGKTNIYDIQPQMWTYEKDNYRAMVCIPGHLYFTFEKPHFRAILLRAISWTAKHTHLDEYCKPEEIAALTYPEGGPQKPADTLKSLEIHPDFKFTLMAAEPLITKPMNFEWAPDGSMWVAETPEYPNGKRGMRPDYRGKEWKDHGGIDPTPGMQTRKGQDKISRLVDTNGDGVMDKKEVFYEGLELVTGMVFYKDGVIVTQSPDVLWLRDTDHDGKCDKVEKLYTGLGNGDTHAVINNPRWGWDGWIYCTHGYSGGKVTSGDGTKAFGNMGSGVVRFKPDGSAFEQYSSQGGNSWGLEITGDNRVMWTQPTSGTLLNEAVLPEYALARGKIGNTRSSFNIIGAQKTYPAMTWEQAAYAQIDRIGDFTAGAGCAVYDGGTWPAEYNGDYFVTEPTINIVAHERLTPKGISSSAAKLPGREETEFIRSKDMWWRPIEVRVGPDGAVYVGDFYNQAVIHNDTRGPDHNSNNAAVRPDRDHYFGRIWRIDHKDAKHNAVPDLSHAKAVDLANALAHPNRVVRMTASRLLIEMGTQKDIQLHAVIDPILKPLLTGWATATPETKIASLWTLAALGSVPADLYEKALTDKDPTVRRNIALVSESAGAGKVTDLLRDPDAHVRLAALRAMGSHDISIKDANALIGAWPKFDDDFQRSAAIGAAARNPAASLAAAFDSAEPATLAPLINALTQSVSGQLASNIVIALASKPQSVDALKRSTLEALSKNVKDAPPMTPELKAALTQLLSGATGVSVLPIVAKWDSTGQLKDQVLKLTAKLLSLADNPNAEETARIDSVRSLIGLSRSDASILPPVLKQLGAENSPAFQLALISALADSDHMAVGPALAAAYGKLPAAVQPTAFDTLLKRAAWANALLDAIKAGQIKIAAFNPAAGSRLRTHPDQAVAKRAVAMWEELNPGAQMKKQLIAKLSNSVQQPGDAQNGKTTFTATCAICHNYDGAGADIGPGLTGMGAHGALELLTAIVDPNAEVDPSFLQWNIETRNGGAFAGVIAAENPTTITLKSLAGVQQVKVSDIKSRVNTGFSLMPEGFGGLPPEQIRDIIAYMQSVDGGRFRVADMKSVFDADTRQGLYASQQEKTDTLPFKKFGTVTVEGVPFTVVDPAKSATGNNVLILKGGAAHSFASTLPARVELKMGGFKANRLHFLGGVTGWGFQGQGEPSPVMKITVVYTDTATEEIVCKNGVEFADYAMRVDVPGSKFADVLKDHQVRYFAKQLKRTGSIDKIIMESHGDGAAAPTTVGITAELADPNATPLPAPGADPKSSAVSTATADAEPGFKAQFNDEVPQPPLKANGPRVLMVGGGSSHDFVKFFGETDKATLKPVVGWADFTQNANGIAAVLDRVDVLIWSANQAISSATRKALIDYANRGGAIIAMHPGTWYAWGNFPQWNKEIIGGGTRGHDPLGPYPLKVINASHPITLGVPAEFEITDELYNYNPDPAATPVEVLVTATSPKTGKVFPQVFVVKHPKARIVGITLGHDARAHDLPAYQTLLRNAVKWVSKK